MLETMGLGQILVLLINYADEKDIAKLIKNCYPKISKKDMQDLSYATNFKEYLIHKLCIAQYATYQYIQEYNLETFRNILKKYDIEILILHLIALQKGFNNFLFLDKGLDSVDMEKLMNATQYKKGFVKIALKGNINEKDITKILSLLINNYSKYNIYYEYIEDDLIQKLEVELYKNKYKVPNSQKVTVLNHYRFKKTPYLIKKCTNYTILKNSITGKELKINGRLAITPLYENKSGHIDVQAINYDDFQKINNAVCKALASDIEREPCIWCNPTKNIKSVMCQNCKNLLEELEYYQENDSIDRNITVKADIKNIKLGLIRTQNTLLKSRKNYMLDLINSPNCKLNEEEKEQIKSLIDKSFG